VGLGFDVHSVDKARPLILGGVEIPGAPGLAGHSDADVVTHAIADALLGAAGLGDLGEHFPATGRWKDAASIEILSETGRMIRAAGWKVVDVDATIVAEMPRLSPFRDEMRRRLASALDAAVDDVSIKATTTDGLGFTGRGEGIAAYAVALVSRVEP
jgi:2-C-methyl-D-erythritol 2,4-cyclodiphosphate synthase